MAMREVLDRLYKRWHSALLEDARDDSMWNFVPYIVSYCCENFEFKDMLAIWHRIWVERLWICCMVTVDNLKNLSQCPSKDMQYIVELGVEYNQLLQNTGTAGTKTYGPWGRCFQASESNTLSALLLTIGPSFLERSYTTLSRCAAVVYSIIVFEPLQNFHMRISIMLESCLLQYFLSNSFHTKPARRNAHAGSLSGMKNCRLKVCSSLLSGLERNSLVSGPSLDFLKSEASAQLNDCSR